MTYYVKMKLVKNNLCFGQSIVDYNFKSEIKTLEPQNNKELLKEVIDFYTENIKKSFNDFDNLIIENIALSFIGLHNEYNNRIPEEYKELYENSKKEQNEILESKEYKINSLISTMNDVKNIIKIIREEAEKLEMLDSQEFLNYQDELNKYSLDPDRK